MAEHEFEKLGVFYLGKAYEQQQGRVLDELLLYDSKDLTTHAMCVGMTGSGKTGLCLSLLEEAAIDGIPAIAIDPKGDLGNLALTFPALNAADFRPWIDDSAAMRAGMKPDEFAAEVANRWRVGLQQWGQAPDRIGRFRDSVDFTIYTPGSEAGIPLTILKSFDAPPSSVRDDRDAFNDRVTSAASGLLALLGINADPVRSREHILLANIMSQAWSEGRNLDLAQLIREIQQPSFSRLGVFDLETFYPEKDRATLAFQLNNLLASPSFASWMAGEPLDIQRLLYTAAGKPRLSVISIAHLSEAERMFFVTILLNEIVTWIRAQPGTSSLRALLYMDEVFGYFPPTANPPSKRPMLTLLKQARAFGLGVVLATQNPVDLDYKGLSNIGTWFLGRLQTERDKARVLEGLEGVAAGQAGAFDRSAMEQTLAGLGSRVFLMNNVHDDAPLVFHTRWCLSYLRGPLTREQIKLLMDEKRQSLNAAENSRSQALSSSVPVSTAGESQVPLSAHEPPHVASDVVQRFVVPQVDVPHDCTLVYRPALYAVANLHYVRASYKLDAWKTLHRLTWLTADAETPPWKHVLRWSEQEPAFADQAVEGSQFDQTPKELSSKSAFGGWESALKKHLYRDYPLRLFRCKQPKLISEAEETEGDFRVRLAQAAREDRDLEMEKLRKRYAKRLSSLQDKIRTAEAAVERESSQFHKASFESAIKIGSSIMGALFGRKLASRTNVSSASTSMRSIGSAAQQRGDIARAKEKLQAYQQQLQEMESELHEELKSVEQQYAVDSLEVETLTLSPRKSDIQVQRFELLWMPWRVTTDGQVFPCFNVSAAEPDSAVVEE